MILSVCCQKGGTGKTTTAASIAQAMAYKGKKTLLVDLDPQGSATLIYGVDGQEPNSYDLITGRADAAEIIQHTNAGDIIPSGTHLEGLDVELAKTPGRDSLLQEALKPVRKKYDLIVIDTAPGMGTCLVQALTASDMAVIPLLCDPQALSGLSQVMNTIDQVKKYCNKRLKVGAVVLTQYQPRATLTRQYEQLISEQCEQLYIVPMAKTRIRKAIVVQEAQAMRSSLYEYAPTSKPAEDYLNLVDELNL